MTLDDLIAEAEARGLRVKWADLGRRAGELHSSGLVRLNHRRTAGTQRVALAHELGHHHCGHDWSAMHDVARDEREADLYAASLLFSPVEYALAERLYDGHPAGIARELDVPVRLVELWRTDVLRRQPRAVGRHLRAV